MQFPFCDAKRVHTTRFATQNTGLRPIWSRLLKPTALPSDTQPAVLLGRRSGQLRCSLRISVVVFSLLGVITAASAQAQDRGAPPVLNSDAPDPSVVYDEGTSSYFVFTTQALTPGGGFARLPRWRSRDLQSWEYLGDALAVRPLWTARASTVVAPYVVRLSGRWVLYFSAMANNGQMCIGRAFSADISQRFIDESSAPLVCGRGDGNRRDRSFRLRRYK